MSLRGRAQRVLSELSYRELGNYSELKCALTQRFSPPERETAHKCEFRTRRRKSGETVSEYGYSLRRLASRAYPTFPSDMRESLTVEHFVIGLGCHELKRYVQFSHPKTLDRAISLALEIESFEGSQDTPRNIEKPHVGYARAVLPPVDKNDNNSHVNLEKLEESIQQMIQKTLKSMEFKGHDGPYERRPNGRGRHQEIVCYACNETGHIRCPKKNSKPKNNNGTHNDNRHLNENGLSPRPQAQPLKNPVMKIGQNETYQLVCTVFREVVGL